MSNYRNQLETVTKGTGTKHRKRTWEPKEKQNKSLHIELKHYSILTLSEGASSHCNRQSNSEGRDVVLVVDRDLEELVKGETKEETMEGGASWATQGSVQMKAHGGTNRGRSQGEASAVNPAGTKGTSDGGGDPDRAEETKT